MCEVNCWHQRRIWCKIFTLCPVLALKNILKICAGADWKQHLFPYRTNWRLIRSPIRGTHRRNHSASFASPPIKPLWKSYAELSSLKGLGIFILHLIGATPSYLWLLWNLWFHFIFMFALNVLTRIVLQCPSLSLGGGGDAPWVGSHGPCIRREKNRGRK